MVGSEVLGHHKGRFNPWPDLAQKILERFQASSGGSDGHHAREIRCHVLIVSKSDRRGRLEAEAHKCAKQLDPCNSERLA
jgi:hypothetical protein